MNFGDERKGAESMTGRIQGGAGWLLVGFSLLAAAPASSYPLDGYPNTGISRVEGMRRAQRGSKGAILPPGAELTTDRIILSLQHLSLIHI